MSLNHLRWRSEYTDFHTELSSWAASLQVVFTFARWFSNKHSIYISIIDTTELPNTIVHAAALEPIIRVCYWQWEYLAHGVISGDAHKAVPLQSMMNIGIPYSLDMTPLMPVYGTDDKTPEIPDISAVEFQDAQTVAVQYGNKFGAAVIIAILCLKQRDSTLWRCGTNGVELQLNEYLLNADFDIPELFCTDKSILTDIVYTKGYEGLEQMIRMLQAVVDLRYGKGARNKGITRRPKDRKRK